MVSGREQSVSTASVQESYSSLLRGPFLNDISAHFVSFLQNPARQTSGITIRLARCSVVTVLDKDDQNDRLHWGT